MRALLASSLLFPTVALASGFAVSEQDASASGRAGTAIAVAGAASSIQFNPAGLGAIDGLSASAGATLILPSATATDPAGAATSTESGLKVPPHVYAAWGFGTVAIGAGFNAPFGGGLKWPAGWYGSTELLEMKLQVLTGHLGGAWRINEQWSVGASLQLSQVSVGLLRSIDFVDTTGTAQLGGSGLAVGAQAGVNFSPTSQVRLGLSGRLPATASLSGQAHFSSVPPSFNATLPDQTITSSITLPARLALGADVRLPVVRLVADAELTFWSSFQSFDVDFSDPATPDVSQPRDWHTAPTFRLGAEKDFGLTTARLGALLDFAASPSDTLSPSLPDSTRLGFSAGVGRGFGALRADLAYQFVAFLPRAATGTEALPATYTANAHLLALSLSFNWAKSTN